MARIEDVNENPILDDVSASATLLGVNDEVNLTLHGPAACAVSLVFSGWTGTVVFEGSVNGSDYFPIRATRGSDGLVTDQPTTDGAYYLSVGGLANIRTRVSAWTAGTISCAMKAGQGSIPPAPPSLGTVDQGPGGDPTDPWVMLPVDGDGDPITDNANDSLRVSIVSGGGSGTEYADGAARGTATGTLAMGDDGVNIQSVKVDSSGRVAIQDDGGSITVDGTVSVSEPVSVDDNAGSLTVDSPQLPALLAAGGGLKVEGVAGGVAVPISAAALPLPTGAATSALQLPDGHNVTVDNAAGASAVNVQDGGNSLTVDGTVTADTELPTAAALADAAANPTAPAVDARASLYNGATWDRMRGDTTNGLDVDVTRLGPGYQQTASGSFTAAAQTVVIALQGEANAAFQLTGTWSATVIFEATVDGSTWVPIYAYEAGDNQITVSGITVNGVYRCTVAGFHSVRARCSAYTSGTVVVTARSTNQTSGVFQNFPPPSGPNSQPPLSSNVTASGNTTLVAAPGAGLSIYVNKGVIVNRAATNRLVALTDGAGGTVRLRGEARQEGGGFMFDFGNRGWKLTANTALVCNLDAAGDVDVNVSEYYIAP